MATQERGIKDKIYSRLRRSQEDYKQPEYQPAQSSNDHNGHYNGENYSYGGGYQQAGGPPQHGYGGQQQGYGGQQGYEQQGYSGGQQGYGGPQQAGGPIISLQKQPYDAYQQQQQHYDPYQQQQHFHQNDAVMQGDNMKIEDTGKKEWKEENDLTCLMKSLERSVHGQEQLSPDCLIDNWIKEKETKLKRWRQGMKSGAGVQTFGIGLVTFGLGPIPINMALMASLNKHIVHTFTLDDPRVDNFVKSTFAYGGKEVGKKLGTLIAKTLFVAGSSSAVGIVPLIGPMISATMTAHKISKTAKQTTQDCAELVRELCQEALRANKFDLN